MARKVLRKSFENFKGLHKGFTDLLRPAEFATVAKNVVLEENFIACQRRGGKLVSQNPTTGQDFWAGIHSYSKASTKRIIPELLVGGPDGLYKVAEATFSISPVPVGGTFSFLPNSSGVWEARLEVSGVPVAGWPKTYGTGLELGPPTFSDYDTLQDLIDDIAAEVGWGSSASLVSEAGVDFPAAIIPVTPTIGPGIDPIQIPFTYLTKIGDWFTDYDQSQSYLDLFSNPSFITLNDVVFIGTDLNGSLGAGNDVEDGLHKYDGRKLYKAGVTPATIVIILAGAVGVNFPANNTYKYRIRHVRTDAQGNVVTGEFSEPDIIGSTFNTGSTARNDLTVRMNTYGGGDFRLGAAVVDGDQGFPPGGVNTITVLAGHTLTTDDSATLRRQGLGQVSGNQVGVTTITTTAGGHSFVVGDEIRFINRITGLTTLRSVVSVGATTIGISGTAVDVNNGDLLRGGKIETRAITATTATTITISGSAVAVFTGDVISAECVTEIYRTLGNSDIYRLVYEVPTSPFGTFFNFSDNLSDEGLRQREELIEALVIRDIPVRAAFLETHQQLLCMAGIRGQPSRVYFSDITSPEIVPRDSFIDIPFTGRASSPSMYITGIASDGERLYVFKADARAVIEGDIASGNFFVRVEEDGIGCPSNDSIEKGEDGLYFMSNIGPQRIGRSGIPDRDFYFRLANDFKDLVLAPPKQLISDTYLLGNTLNVNVPFYRRSIGLYDFRKKRYILMIPALDPLNSGSVIPTSNTQYVVYDEKNDTWTNWDFPLDQNMLGGAVIHNGEMYRLSWYGVNQGGNKRTKGNLFKEHNRNDQYDAADNTLPIEFDLRPQWDTMGEPTAFKKALSVKTWQMDPVNFFPFLLTIRSYRNFDASTFHSEVTQNFDLATRIERASKLLSAKSRSIQFQFYNNTLHEAPRISGMEYEIALPYSSGEIKEPRRE